MPVKQGASGSGAVQTRQVSIWPDGSVAVKDAAVLFSVSGQTIMNWIQDGAPHTAGTAGRGNPTRIKVSEVAQWRTAKALADHGADGDQAYNEGRAKAMDWHYRAIKRRADACREIGTLIPVDLIADVVEADYQRVRTRLSSIAPRLAVRIAAESDPAQARQMIDAAIHDAMTSLSAPDAVIERASGDPSRSIHDSLDLDDDDEIDADAPGDETDDD